MKRMLHIVSAPRRSGPLPLLCFLHGNGVFDLALAQPDVWAALWPVDPTRVPRKPPAQPLWLSAGSIARPQRQAFMHALALRTQERVWADDGEDHVGSARV